MSDDKQGYTVNELAEAAGVSTSYVRRLLGSGDIQGRKVGEGRRGVWYIPASEARRWLEDRAA